MYWKLKYRLQKENTVMETFRVSFVKKIFYYFSITVMSQFSPLCPPLPSPPPTPTVNPQPVVHVHGSFMHVPWLVPSPSFPPYTPSPSPLVAVSLFFVSMPLVLFCRFVCFVHYVPIIGEIIWYLPFPSWLISLSIILSSSSMLSWRVGVPSFFLQYSIQLCKCTTVFWSTRLLMGT